MHGDKTVLFWLKELNEKAYWEELDIDLRWNVTNKTHRLKYAIYINLALMNGHEN